jgi:hypothetical protein
MSGLRLAEVKVRYFGGCETGVREARKARKDSCVSISGFRV